MGYIYLREDHEEDFNYNLDIQIINNKVLIGDDYIYRRDFKEGDIVTNDNINFGYVYYIKEQEVKVCWSYGVNEWENKIDLLGVAPTFPTKSTLRQKMDKKFTFYPL